MGHVFAGLSCVKVIYGTRMSVGGIFEDFLPVMFLMFWLRFSISLPAVFVAMFLIEAAFDVEPT